MNGAGELVNILCITPAPVRACKGTPILYARTGAGMRGKRLNRHKGEINYESVNDMPYLEMCIKETLRKYPSLPFLDRVSKEKYLLPNTKEEIYPETFVYIPIYGLHMDPEYYPEPHKYDPERFTRENVDKRNPFTYIPFGNGPRNCIGERLAIVQVKICLIKLIKNYIIDRCPDTPDVIPMDPKSIMIRPLNGIHLELSNRKPINNYGF